MLFKIDENLPCETCAILEQAGYNAVSVHDQQMVGTSDSILAEVCMRENRIIITLDTDFGNIISYPPDRYPGIIVIRTDDQSKDNVLRFIDRIAVILKTESPKNKLWIVEKERIRVRGAEA